MYLTVKNICFEKALDLSFPFKQLEITPFFKGYSNENNYRGRNIRLQYNTKKNQLWEYFPTINIQLTRASLSEANVKLETKVSWWDCFNSSVISESLGYWPAKICILQNQIQNQILFFNIV